MAGVDAVVGNSHKAMLGQMVARLEEAAASFGVYPAGEGGWPGRSAGAGRRSLRACQPGGGGPGRFRGHAAESEGAGRMRKPLLLLHHPDDAGQQPLCSTSKPFSIACAASPKQAGKSWCFPASTWGDGGGTLQRPARLEELVGAILDQTALPRLRISSVEPMDWSAELLALYRQYGRADAAPTGPRLARHAHLPLQSGSDAILRAMHRRYRPWHYAEKLAAIREAMPDAAIGADVMVGFPGETDALFEESYRFIAEQPFTYLHLFPFSARPGTAAWSLAKEKPVRGEAVRERMDRLRALMEDKQTAFRERVGRGRLSVVTLKASDEHRARGMTPALSDNFLHIEMDGNFSANQMLWAVVSHRKIDENHSTATGWQAIPMTEGRF